jgi:MYXO-CTERM domain-containing protein
VVGNMLIKRSEWRIARIGGDGSGSTSGRYRFVNNTMVLAPSTTSAITLQDSVETLEMYNNVIQGPKSGFKVYDITQPSGPAATLFGSNNWVLTGTTSIPAPWTATDMGGDPGWVDPAGFDYRPGPGSPLDGMGTSTTEAAGSLAFPSPLALPVFMPPERRLIAVGAAEARQNAAMPDIGAFAQNANPPGAPVQPPGSTGAGSGTSSGGGGSGSSTGGGTGTKPGCGCRVAGAPDDTAGWLAMGLVACLPLVRRRRRGG